MPAAMMISKGTGSCGRSLIALEKRAPGMTSTCQLSGIRSSGKFLRLESPITIVFVSGLIVIDIAFLSWIVFLGRRISSIPFLSRSLGSGGVIYSPM